MKSQKTYSFAKKGQQRRLSYLIATVNCKINAEVIVI